MRRRVLGVCWVFVLMPLPLRADEVLVLHYNERPPYNISGGAGLVYGLTASPAAAALGRAGIRFRWEYTPLARQFKLIELGRGFDCAVGLFRNPGRERAGKFSAPLYRDRGMVGIARAELGLRDGGRMADLMRDRRLRLMMKAGLTYGATTSAMVAAHRPNIEAVSVESHKMVQMIKADRADWMIATEEEAGYLVAQAGLGPKDVSVLHFSDVKQGEYRHLFCSRAVPDALIERINAALPQLKPK